MVISLENVRSTTGTKARLPDISPLSGMCPLCIRECAHLCEVSKLAFRGREVLYPSPEVFGLSTAAANKYMGLSWADFQIMVEVIGAKGMEPEPRQSYLPFR